MNPCVFLDRDGVLNTERGTYTWKVEDFMIIPGVPEALNDLKNAGYKLVVITNQGGISRGIFTREEMEACHELLLRKTGRVIDEIYFAAGHPDDSESLLRKPDSLMFEKAMARFDIDPERSWMAGNSERDLVPARKLGIRTIFIGEETDTIRADHYTGDLRKATEIILGHPPLNRPGT